MTSLRKSIKDRIYSILSKDYVIENNYVEPLDINGKPVLPKISKFVWEGMRITISDSGIKIATPTFDFRLDDNDLRIDAPIIHRYYNYISICFGEDSNIEITLPPINTTIKYSSDEF